jgi:hypothetical protein
MRRSRKMERYLRNGRSAGRSNMLYNRRLTSRSRRTLEVALLYLIRRDNPSSKEGIKVHHYSDSSPTINVRQQSLIALGKTR